MKADTYYIDLLVEAGVVARSSSRRPHTKVSLKLSADDGTGGPEKPCQPNRKGSCGGHGGAVGARDGVAEKPTEKATEKETEPCKKRRRQQHSRTYRFGPHIMIFKEPGSWQATCCRRVFHRKPGHAKTFCTRTAKYPGEAGGESDLLVQRTLLHWLNASHDHVTRSEHMAVRNEDLRKGLPSLKEIWAKRLPDDHKTDTEVDGAKGKAAKDRRSSSGSSSSSSSEDA